MMVVQQRQPSQQQQQSREHPREHRLNTMCDSNDKTLSKQLSKQQKQDVAIALQEQNDPKTPIQQKKKFGIVDGLRLINTNVQKVSKPISVSEWDGGDLISLHSFHSDQTKKTENYDAITNGRQMKSSDMARIAKEVTLCMKRNSKKGKLNKHNKKLLLVSSQQQQQQPKKSLESVPEGDEAEAVSPKKLKRKEKKKSKSLTSIPTLIDDKNSDGSYSGSSYEEKKKQKRGTRKSVADGSIRNTRSSYDDSTRSFGNSTRSWGGPSSTKQSYDDSTRSFGNSTRSFGGNYGKSNYEDSTRGSTRSYGGSLRGRSLEISIGDIKTTTESIRKSMMEQHDDRNPQDDTVAVLADKGGNGVSKPASVSIRRHSRSSSIEASSRRRSRSSSLEASSRRRSRSSSLEKPETARTRRRQLKSPHRKSERRQRPLSSEQRSAVEKSILSTSKDEEETKTDDSNKLKDHRSKDNNNKTPDIEKRTQSFHDRSRSSGSNNLVVEPRRAVSAGTKTQSRGITNLVDPRRSSSAGTKTTSTEKRSSQSGSGSKSRSAKNNNEQPRRQSSSRTSKRRSRTSSPTKRPSSTRHHKDRPKSFRSKSVDNAQNRGERPKSLRSKHVDNSQNATTTATKERKRSSSSSKKLIEKKESSSKSNNSRKKVGELFTTDLDQPIMPSQDCITPSSSSHGSKHRVSFVAELNEKELQEKLSEKKASSPTQKRRHTKSLTSQNPTSVVGSPKNKVGKGVEVTEKVDKELKPQDVDVVGSSKLQQRDHSSSSRQSNKSSSSRSSLRKVREHHQQPKKQVNNPTIVVGESGTKKAHDSDSNVSGITDPTASLSSLSSNKIDTTTLDETSHSKGESVQLMNFSANNLSNAYRKGKLVVGKDGKKRLVIDVSDLPEDLVVVSSSSSEQSQPTKTTTSDATTTTKNNFLQSSIPNIGSPVKPTRKASFQHTRKMI